MSVKVAASVLTVIFAGSYISCIVQSEIEDYKKELAETSANTDLTVEVTEPVTEQIPVQTTVPAVTTVAEVTTVPEVTTEISTVPVTTTEITTTVSETVTELTTTEITTTITTSSETTKKITTTESQKYDYSSSVPESDKADTSYFNKCAFIGDSHINGLGGYNIVDSSRVFASNGLSLAHINESISVSDVKAIEPENVYIMMGTNGVMWTDFSTMIEQYEEFVESIQEVLPSANIYIISIPPVTSERETRADVKSGKFLNSSIDSYNEKLLDMAESNKWYFVDINSVLKDQSGCLIASTDGVHMTKDLYSTFKDYILCHIA